METYACDGDETSEGDMLGDIYEVDSKGGTVATPTGGTGVTTFD